MTNSQDIKTNIEISPGASTILEQFADIHLIDILNMKMIFPSVILYYKICKTLFQYLIFLFTITYKLQRSNI
jgi:hypothetical protein